MLQLCKEEFSPKHLRLHHEDPICFVLSHWQKNRDPNVYYLIYKWLVAVVFVVIFLLSVIQINDLGAPASQKVKWLIYLTDWGFTVCTLQALVSAILLTICVINPDHQKTALKIYKVYWVLHIIATDMAFVITILYWSLLFTPGMNVEVMNFLVHGNNTVLMLIDLFVVAHPVRLVQCVHPIFFGLCYAVFSVIYFLAGGTNNEGDDYIYPVLDWNKAGVTAALCVGVVFLVAAVHGVCWTVHQFKVWINAPTKSSL